MNNHEQNIIINSHSLGSGLFRNSNLRFPAQVMPFSEGGSLKARITQGLQTMVSDTEGGGPPAGAERPKKWV